MAGGGGGEAASSKLKRVARKILRSTCVSFSRRQTHVDPLVFHHTVISGSPNNPPKQRAINSRKFSEISAEGSFGTTTTDTPGFTKNLCAICLDPLNYGTGTSPGQAIFTAQCSHSFHFTCISSNIRHGNVTCPICRAQWTQLPRNLNAPCSLSTNQTDPVLQILDDSIANFRVHRRSFLQSARYDDDDPVDPDYTLDRPRLHLSLVPFTASHSSFPPCSHESLQESGLSSRGYPLHHVSGSSSLLTASQHLLPTGEIPYMHTPNIDRAYLSVTLAEQQATDVVLVASPNGPHLRLIKQSMALVAFSLRPIDRLAIVTYSSSAARVFPLRRMTSYGKRTALQIIDRLFYMGQADPIEGLNKGMKVLGDRAYKNPQSCIIQLSDNPTTSYHCLDMEVPIPIPIHQFHVGYGFGTSNGFVMHEFENFLARVLGGMIRNLKLKIGEDARVVMLGELRGGEERRIPLNVDDYGHIYVEYSYVEGAISDECIRKAEIMVGLEDKRERSGDGSEAATRIAAGRTSNAESWDYHDPNMARRWAKHLHGYRL